MTDTKDVRRVRPFFIVAAVALLLPALIVATAAIGLGVFHGSACGCASTPSPRDPNWTASPPPPVSPDQAAARAAALAGVSLASALNWDTMGGRPISEPYGNAAVGFVDGNSGAVLALVLKNELPISDSASVSEAAAGSAAQAFLARGGLTFDGLTQRTQLVHRASVAYLDLTWAKPGATEPDLEILVSASSGKAFAYRDMRSGLNLAVPIVGSAAATRLARESALAQGEMPSTTELQDADLQLIAGKPNGPEWFWSVGFPDGLIYVDAVTGEVSIGKWSSSH